MATRMAKLGATGVVIDGRLRDVSYIRGLGLPVDRNSSGSDIVGICSWSLSHRRRCRVSSQAPHFPSLANHQCYRFTYFTELGKLRSHDLSG
jgi:Aldolase/RraA